MWTCRGKAIVSDIPWESPIQESLREVARRDVDESDRHLHYATIAADHIDALESALEVLSKPEPSLLCRIGMHRMRLIESRLCFICLCDRGCGKVWMARKPA